MIEWRIKKPLRSKASFEPHISVKTRYNIFLSRQGTADWSRLHPRILTCELFSGGSEMCEENLEPYTTELYEENLEHSAGATPWTLY